MTQEKTGPRLGNPGAGNDKRAASHPKNNSEAPPGAALTGLSSARDLHERGFHVFPVDHPGNRECIGKHEVCDGQRGKHPAVKWGVWAIAATPQMIELEWGKHRGLANIGIACGPSRLVVLDEDAAGEIDRWCVAYDVTLPDTYTVTTGRGEHRYFGWDHTKQRIGNSPKAVEGFTIDVRGDGGFVVAEGSRHEGGALYVGNGAEVAELPDEVADLLLAGASERPDPTWQVVDGAEVVDHNTAKIGFHHRHDALVAYAGRLRKSGLDRTEAEPTFRARWLLCEQPEGQIPEARYHSPDVPYPVTWEEAEAKLRDVFTRYPAGSTLNGAAHVDLDDITEPVGRLTVEHLEDDFWDRPSLRTIYDAALARMCSPWAVLAFCAARALAQVRPCVVLPPVICGPGSLNWFVIITAASGGGKDGAAQVAKELVPSRVQVCKPGSGEGTVQAYILRGPKGQVAGYREALMFEASEVDALTALAARTASNIMPVLRDGFSGAALGFGYSDPKKATYIPAQSYRMTFVLSVQPSRAGPIFDGEGGGTPQRFLWFPAKDARATREGAKDRFVGTLELPDLGQKAYWQQYPRTLVIPDAAVDLIMSVREQDNRGELDALDGHAVFCREKFAYALTILDGRTEMSEEDWVLSGIAAAVSNHVRGWVAGQQKVAAHRQAAEAGELRGVTLEAADNQKSVEQTRRVQRVRRWVLTKLDEAGGAMSNRDLSRAITSVNRPALRDALKSAVDLGLIRLADDQVTWEKL